MAVRPAQAHRRTALGHPGGAASSSCRQGCNPNSRPGVFGRGHARRRCPRDTYPLPVPPKDDMVGTERRVCRAVARRVCRRRQRGHLVSDVVGSLNDLWCGSGSGSAFAHERLSLAQEHVLGRVESAVEAFGPPPPDLSGPGALEALRVSAPDGYGSDAQGARAAYDSSLLSLPAEGTTPTPLEVLWGSGGRQFVEDFCDTHASPSSCVEAQLERLGLERGHTDLVVQRPHHWSQFLRRLQRCGVVEFCAEAPVETAGVFFL